MRKILSALFAMLFAMPAIAGDCNLLPMQSDKIVLGQVFVGPNFNDNSANFYLDYYIPVQPNTTYTFSTSTQLKNVKFGEFTSNKDFISRLFSEDVSAYTFTTSENTQYLLMSANINNSNIESVNTVLAINWQLELGDTATEYTPYNPLCGMCKNGVSPNLFETVDMTSGLYGVTLTSAANGLVTVVGTATGGGGRNTARLQNFTLPAGTYTVSFSGTKRSQLYLVAGNDSNATNLITDVNGGTFTISESKTLHFGLNLNNGTTYNDSFYIQLEAGSTATPYQPYGCIEPIKIATTKYNESAFSPLNTALQNAISVVDSVVSNTITQAASIATLQAQKQTRPNDIADDNEKCPAGKKCLLVEDASGVPHWYEIVERYSFLPDGYTELEYIESTGTQYIDTGLNPKPGVTSVEFEAAITDTSTEQIFGARQAASATGGSYNIFANVSPNQFRLDWVGASGTIVDGIVVGTFYKFVLNADGSVDFQNEHFERAAPKVACDYNMYLFGANNAGVYTENSLGKVRYKGAVKIKERDTLVRDFVPAKNASGVVGMYDLVSGAFFTNAGTGEFIAGPVAE